jgi:hypothetical protein
MYVRYPSVSSYRAILAGHAVEIPRSTVCHSFADDRALGWLTRGFAPRPKAKDRQHRARRSV